MIGDQTPLMKRLHASLRRPFDRLSEQDAAAIVESHWALEPTAVSRIDTARDDTFIIESLDGSFLLKAAGPDDDPLEIDLQLAAMEHARTRDPGLPVQELVRTTQNETSVRIEYGPQDEQGESAAIGHSLESTDTRCRTVRVFTFLPGAMLQDLGANHVQLRQCGRMLARLSRALSDFEHPAADRYQLWDLQHVDELDELLGFIEHPERREAIACTLETIMRDTLPVLRTTRSQVVHDSFRGDNLVANPNAPEFITGILDFNGTVRSYLAADLAVAMSYANSYACDTPPAQAIPSGGKAWAAASALLIGYTGITGLSVTELDVIPDLVLGSLAQQMLLGSWLAASAPPTHGNPDIAERELERVWWQFEELQASRP